MAATSSNRFWAASFCCSLLSFSMSSCADATYPDFAELERPEVFRMSIIKIDGEAPRNNAPEDGFLWEALDQAFLPGGCCVPDHGFSARRAEREGKTVSAQLVFNSAERNSVFFSIVLPDQTLQDMSLVAPLFGGGIRSHPMTEPRGTCRVVSGVRDNILRVGVVTHTVRKVLKPGLSPALRYDYEDGSHCNMVALLMLFGFSEDEAQNYMPYVLDERGDEGEVIPDYAAITARAAELSAQGRGWPDWGEPLEAGGE